MIDERIVAQQLNVLDSHGGDAEAALRKAGVTSSLRSFLSHDLATIDVETLKVVAGKAAVEICNIDAASVGRPSFRGEDWLLMFYCLLSSPSLGEALARACAFHQTVGGRFGAMELYIHGETAELSLVSPPDPLSRLGFVSAAFGMMNLHGLFSWLIGRFIPISNSFFAYSERMRDLIEPELIPFPMSFGADRCALIFPASYLDYPVIRTFQEWSKRPLLCFFVGAERDAAGDSIAERARCTMLAALRRGESLYSLDQLASEVGLNRETFRRRLRTAGVSYNLIKDGCRRDFGLELLDRTSMSMEAISDSLNFCDSDEFRRAVHKWTGLSPSAYRRKGRIGTDHA